MAAARGYAEAASRQVCACRGRVATERARGVNLAVNVSGGVPERPRSWRLASPLFVEEPLFAALMVTEIGWWGIPSGGRGTSVTPRAQRCPAGDIM